MTRFHGEVGYGESVEVSAGVYDDVITERVYSGDVVRNTRRLLEGQKVNDDLSVSNSISIVADAYALQHFYKMRYVKWQGVRWKVTEVEEQRPRMLLRLGGVYNGPQPAPVTP